MLWVVLQPVAFALVYASFLTLFGSIPSQGVPYGVFALTSMTLWLFLVAAMSRVSDSTVSSAPLISKIWFPRMIIPLAALGPAIVDLLVSSVVLLAAMLLFGVVPEAKILLAPFAALLALLCALGVGVWFSAIAVRYRDIEQLVPFLTQILLFVTPILYPSDVVPHAVAGAPRPEPARRDGRDFPVDGAAGRAVPGTDLAITLVFVAIVLPTGLRYLRATPGAVRR